MKRKVLKTCRLGNDTAVAIEGKIPDNEFNIYVYDEKGKKYKYLSYGMENIMDLDMIGKSSSVLIEGHFTSKEIIFPE